MDRIHLVDFYNTCCLLSCTSSHLLQGSTKKKKKKRLCSLGRKCFSVLGWPKLTREPRLFLAEFLPLQVYPFLLYVYCWSDCSFWWLFITICSIATSFCVNLWDHNLMLTCPEGVSSSPMTSTQTSFWRNICEDPVLMVVLQACCPLTHLGKKDLPQQSLNIVSIRWSELSAMLAWRNNSTHTHWVQRHSLFLLILFYQWILV